MHVAHILHVIWEGIVVASATLHVELVPQLIVYASNLSNPTKMQPTAEYFL